MSFKAYLFKIESSRDAIVLRDYLKDMGDAAWLSFFCHVDEQIDDTKFAPGDIVIYALRLHSLLMRSMRSMIYLRRDDE